MKACWLLGVVLALWSSSASADWRRFVETMAVDVEANLPLICLLDEAALARDIEEAYQEADVAIVAAVDPTPELGHTPHRHSIMLTGTYGGGYCVTAITSYVTREHLVLDAPSGARQEVAYFVTSAFLIAPPVDLQKQMGAALADSARRLIQGHYEGGATGW